MNISDHQKSRSYRLNEFLDAIYEHQDQDELEDEYSTLLHSFRCLLEEYAARDEHKGLDIDSIVESIKYGQMLSKNEIFNRVSGVLEEHAKKIKQNKEAGGRSTHFYEDDMNLQQWITEMNYLDSAYKGDEFTEVEDRYYTDPVRFMNKVKLQLFEYPASEENGYLDANAAFEEINYMTGAYSGDLVGKVLERISVEPVNESTKENHNAIESAKTLTTESDVWAVPNEIYMDNVKDVNSDSKGSIDERVNEVPTASQGESFSEKGLKARYIKNNISRGICLKKASDMWEKESSARISDVVTGLYYHLKETASYCPTKKTIKNWLKEFEKDGKLNIPSAAKAPGAPKLN